MWAWMERRQINFIMDKDMTWSIPQRSELSQRKPPPLRDVYKREDNNFRDRNGFSEADAAREFV